MWDVVGAVNAANAANVVELGRLDTASISPPHLPHVAWLSRFVRELHCFASALQGGQTGELIIKLISTRLRHRLTLKLTGHEPLLIIFSGLHAAFAYRVRR